MKQSSQTFSFDSHDLQAAISLGLEYLAKCQEPDGHLPSYVATDLKISQDRRVDRSVFITQHIVASLFCLDHPAAKRIIQQSVGFLKKESLQGGLWKFWSKDHPGFEAIPPDADDTACVAHLLDQLGEPFTQTNQKIVLGNRNRAGLIHTWILPRYAHLGKIRAWPGLVNCLGHPLQLRSFFRQGLLSPGDLDAVVMANVILWLGERPETSPAIKWLHAVVREGREQESDRYYQSPYPLYYSMARSARIGHKAFDALREVITHRMTLRLQEYLDELDILSIALIAVSLATWKPHTPEFPIAIEKILATQLHDGSWPAHGFFFSACTQDLAWGSEALTTGFCLEALSSCDITFYGAEKAR